MVAEGGLRVVEMEHVGGEVGIGLADLQMIQPHVHLQIKASSPSTSARHHNIYCKRVQSFSLVSLNEKQIKNEGRK